MTEIRRIRPDEGDAFLHLICDAFGLEFERARTVFYHEPYFDLNRKWALFEHGLLVSCLTTTPLLFGWGAAYGIAGVATRRDMRGSGYARRLIQTVLADGEQRNEAPAMLFAENPTLYESLGFESVDVVVRAPLVVTGTLETSVPMFADEVQRRYDRWAQSDPVRLRRDAARWRNWHWHYRVCEELGEGYMASEPGVLREAVLTEPQTSLPLMDGTTWYGMAQVAELLELPTLEPERQMSVMTHRFPARPVMFLTDQF